MFRKSLFYMAIFLSIYCTNSYAKDLLQVFQQALQYDPQFHQKEATWHSREQQTFIQRAELLPKIEAKSQYSKYSAQNTSYPVDDTQSSSISLGLDQPIFNLSSWFNYQEAKTYSKAFQTEYAAALQDLMERVVESYFDVLVAQNQLMVNERASNDYLSLLKWTKARFEGGLAKAVDVDTAQAFYERSIAEILNAQNFLLAKQAHLQTITGIAEKNLASLKNHIPLSKPSPLNIAAWINKVREQNLTILADRYKLQAGKTAINAQRAGHYPTLGANVNRNYNTGSSLGYENKQDTNFILTLTLPIYSGGKTTAQTKKAAYDYQALRDQIEQDYQVQVEQMQNSYQGVINGVQRLETDARIIVADQHALDSTYIAYQAGLSAVDMNTLIQARQRLYQYEQEAFQNKRDYIVNLIKLKQAAGSLSVNDLVALNGWLQR